MKEITRIHLAATPYNVEVDAKKELEKYLHAIEKTLSADDDTVREIEARMVELLLERGVTGDKVVTKQDVEAIKTRLGAPGEFASDQVVAGPIEKRLMRDTQNGMIGGVFSGIAAYTGMDAVWFRLIAVLLAFASFGTVIIVYVVLWLVVPSAKTAAERLQMRGVQPTLENIQEESVNDITEVPTNRKPLVVLLRVFGVLTFVGMAAAGLAVLVFAVLGASPLWFAYNWLANGWLIAAFGLCVISGLLFVSLMAILAYSAGTWRITRSLAVAAAIITVAGLVSFSTAVGVGIYGGNMLQRSIEQHTQKTRTELGQLQGVTQLQVGQSKMAVEYHVTKQAPYAVVEALQQTGKQPVRVAVARAGDTATLKVEDTEDDSCSNMFDLCGNRSTKVTIYGPAIDQLTVHDNTSLNYTVDTQNELKIEQGENSGVSLYGRIGLLNADVKRMGTINADSAAIEVARLHTDQNTTVRLGVLRELDITSPESCGAGASGDIRYERASQVVLNGKVVGVEGDHINCLRITNETDEESGQN